jgi:hypothetical protein
LGIIGCSNEPQYASKLWHLLPLLVCYVVAETLAKKAYEFEMLGKMSSAYLW